MKKIIFFCLFIQSVYTQTNLDFETGTMAGWTVFSISGNSSVAQNVATPVGFPAGGGSRVGYIRALCDGGEGLSWGNVYMRQSYVVTTCNQILTVRFKSCLGGSGEGDYDLGGPWFKMRVDIASGTPALVVGSNITRYESTSCGAAGTGTIVLDLGTLGSPAGNYIGKTATITFMVETCHNDDGYGHGSVYVDASTSCITPLPMILSNFYSTQKSNDEIEINWETETEHDNDYFTLEESTDGVLWQTNSILKAKNTQSKQNYKVLDRFNSPLDQQKYYRLAQTDFNTRTTYSAPIIQDNYTKYQFEVFPNPASKSIHLIAETEIIHYQILNSLGVVVQSDILDKNNEIIFDNLSKGSYIISCEFENDVIKNLPLIIN